MCRAAMEAAYLAYLDVVVLPGIRAADNHNLLLAAKQQLVACAATVIEAYSYSSYGEIVGREDRSLRRSRRGARPAHQQAAATAV